MTKFCKQFLALGAALAVTALTAPAQAAPVQFATFNVVNANQPFSFTNNGANPGTGTIAAAASVTFNFTAQSGLGTGDHTGTVSLTGSTFTPSQSAFGFVDQTVALSTLKITGTGADAGKNLLTLVFTGDIVGKLGGAAASLSGSDTNGQTVQYSSDFLAFTPPGNSFDLSLSTISPVLSVNANGLLNSFLANVSGSFTATIAAVPAPTSVAMFGTGIVAASVLGVRNRKRMVKVNA